MPIASINSIRLSYDDSGTGPPVVFVMGTGNSGRVWHLHQVPALTAAGYRAITFTNRGIPPTDICAQGFEMADLVADTAALIEHLGIAPCRMVGVSMGAFVVQELLLARPEMVSQAVLMATRGRVDTMRAMLTAAELALLEADVRLPAGYEAAMTALRNLSPRTLNDDTAVHDWLEILELSPPQGPGYHAQLKLDVIPNRLAAYRGIRILTLVMAFQDDLLAPPHLNREVADAIPGARYEEIPGCGHFGYLENPNLVNKSIVDFFAAGPGSLR